MNELPEGWEIKKLGEVLNFIGGGTPDKSNKSFWDGDIPWASVKDIKGKYLLKTQDHISENGLKNSSSQLAIPGELILITRITPGKTSISKIKAAINQDLKIIKPRTQVDILFIHYLFATIEKEIIKKSSGTTVLGIRLEILKDLEIPLPPLPVQQAIVAKIEAVFSELDKGVQQLETARQQLKVYRQSVLKWAFEGRLTNENVVDGELPEGWKWVTIDFLISDKKKGMATGPFGTMLKKSEHQNEGVPVLGIENIGEGVFQMPNKIFITSEKSEELRNFRVNENDVLISRSGTVGEICIVPPQMKDAIISTNLIKVTLNQSVVSPKYFVYLFQGGKVRQEVFNLCKGSSRAFLNQTILSSLDFPFCPLSEQQRIVAEIERRLSVCEALETAIEKSLRSAEVLRQGVLARAFSGRLVGG